MCISAEFSSGLNDIDKRKKRTLINGAIKIAQHIGSSFSVAVGDEHRKSVGAILSSPTMVAERIYEGHIQATLDRIRSDETDLVVVSQDTTYYNMTSHKKMEGLGPLQGKLRGVLQHNVLCMNGKGVPLGVLYQLNWARQGLNALAKESEKWGRGLEAVNRYAEAIGKPIILVQDREADIYAFLKALRAAQVDLLVRIHHPRRMELIKGEWIGSLAQVVKVLDVLTYTQVEILREHQPVTVLLAISVGEVNVLPDKDLSANKHKLRNRSLIVAREIDAHDAQGQRVYKEEEAAEWILLSTLPVRDAAHAIFFTRCYALRWRVERFHYVLKSGGLHVQRLQFDDVHTFFNGLALYSIIAWRILYLTYLAREEPELAAEGFFNPLELRLLEAKARKPVKTLAHATLALASLVNFRPSKKQPWPGAKVLGMALVKLAWMVEVLQLFNISFQQ